MVKALSSFMEFVYLVRRSIQTEETITAIEASIMQYRQHRRIFIETDVREDYNLPRQHNTLDHYSQHIRNFGAPNGLCSSITEAKHIKAVKQPWRRSNHYEALGQMLLINQRLDKLAAARVDFTDRGMLDGTCVSAAILELQQTLDSADAVDAPNGEWLDDDEEEPLVRNEEELEVGNDAHDIVDGPRVMASAQLAQQPGV